METILLELHASAVFKVHARSVFEPFLVTKGATCYVLKKGNRVHANEEQRRALQMTHAAFARKAFTIQKVSVLIQGL